MISTCVTPDGRFVYGIHKPHYRVKNLREHDYPITLGHFGDGSSHDNRLNFPAGDVEVDKGKWIYEIANPFSFRGTTYIDSDWAEARKKDPASIQLPSPPACSLRALLRDELDDDRAADLIARLPKPLLYAVAAVSTDPRELALLAENCCRLEMNRDGKPVGLRYRKDESDHVRAEIDDFELFETIANNPCLPDEYKEVMVLRPGVQGPSPIVGEFSGRGSHVFEYLRANSYIPHGHYAANMSHDEVRYRTTDLSLGDMTALRHLYYQRIFVTLAEQVGCLPPTGSQNLSSRELEALRLEVMAAMKRRPVRRAATLWGWNFGYDISGSGYRLHGSHQQIHQQFAMVPESVEAYYSPTKRAGTMTPYCGGDPVAAHIVRYNQETGSDFFSDYIAATRNNERMDGDNGPRNLVVFADKQVMLFVPKAQVSQWELQLMVIADTKSGPVGNVVEADSVVRRSLDYGILLAQRIYARLGARMVTSIEYPKRLGERNGQRLLYSFLPKLPWAMGAFSEAQLRFICGHYPEDFAECCRHQMAEDE